MVDDGLVAEVEAAAYRSWPARELETHDGWELRYADGFSRRGNSVLPVGVSGGDLDEKLEFCRGWFGDRGLPLVVRLTPVCEPGIDDALVHRGYTREGQTHVMVADLTPSDAGHRAMPAEEPDDRWLRAMTGLWGIADEVLPAWSGIIERIDLPAGYGLFEDVAAGLGVVDGPWLGLFEIVVAPQLRRRGHGRELATTLMEWGMAKGACRAFLQVVAENEPAIALYESLGFRHAYDYYYRRDPENSPA